MARIFLSCAQKEESGELAQYCYDLLKNLHEVFLAREAIRPAANWQAELDKNVDRCDCFVVFACKSSVGNSGVISEVKRALERKRPDAPQILTVLVNLSEEALGELSALKEFQFRRWNGETDSHEIVRTIHGLARDCADQPIRTARILLAGSHPLPALAGDNDDLIASYASAKRTDELAGDGLIWLGDDDCPHAVAYSKSEIGLIKLIPGLDCTPQLEPLRAKLAAAHPERIQVVVFASMIHRDGDWYVSGRAGESGIAAVDLVEMLEVVLRGTGIERAALLFHRSRSWSDVHGAHPADFPDDRALHQLEGRLSDSPARWSCRFTGAGEYQIHKATAISPREGFEPLKLADIVAKSKAPALRQRGPLVLLRPQSFQMHPWMTKLSTCARLLGLEVQGSAPEEVQRPGILVVFDDADLLTQRAGTIEGLSVILLGTPWLEAGKTKAALRVDVALRGEKRVLQQVLHVHEIAREIDGEREPPRAEDIELVSAVCGNLLRYDHAPTRSRLLRQSIPLSEPARTTALQRHRQPRSRFIEQLISDLVVELVADNRTFADDVLLIELRRLLDRLKRLRETPRESAGKPKRPAPRPVPIAIRLYNPGGWARLRLFEHFPSTDVSFQSFPEEFDQSGKYPCSIVVIECLDQTESGDWSKAWKCLASELAKRKKVFFGIQLGASVPEELKPLVARAEGSYAEGDNVDELADRLAELVKAWQSKLEHLN